MTRNGYYGMVSAVRNITGKRLVALRTHFETVRSEPA